MKKYLFLLGVLFSVSNLFAIEPLLFKPLVGNTFEPRVGTIYNIDDEKLRLDIGTSIDLSTLHKTDSSEVRLGGGVFTYTQLRSVGHFKFPVEASDYFFGANVSGKTYLMEQPFEWRVRLAHISAHLVDGYASDSVFLQRPFSYSREFIEAIGAVRYKNVRFYGGTTFIFSTLPKNLGKWVPQFGFDGEYKFWRNLYLSYGYDYKISRIKKITKLNATGQLGVIFKSTMKTGIGFYIYNHNGWNEHGMFYDKKLNYTGIGFQLIF